MALTSRLVSERALVVAAIPVYATLMVFLAKTHKLPLDGDEPHYLIMADSLVTDGDLDLKNNYERNAKSATISGPIQPHSYRQPRGWVPYHGAGLSFLVALPFALGGAWAVRVALCVFTGLLPWALFRWLAPMVDPAIASWTIAGIMLAVPILFGSTQIYPDLPCGVISTALVCWLLIRTRERQATRAWPLFWFVSGLLPWLNAKFAVTTIVFTLGGAGLVWRLTRAGGRQAEAHAAAWAMPLVAVGPLLLMAFNLSSSGSVFGLRGAGELTRSPARALMMFVGLHLDQSQGMWFSQPLLLAGVAALVPFARARPRVALFCAALYVSLIGPNSLELARYGLGPSARFAWSAMWLWVVPLGFALAWYQSQLARFVRPAVVVALLYQAAIAVRWLHTPEVLFTDVNGPRDSLFPAGFERWLPSFYAWDFMSYVYNPVNQVALVTIALLIVGGACAAAIGSVDFPAASEIDSTTR